MTDATLVVDVGATFIRCGVAGGGEWTVTGDTPPSGHGLANAIAEMVRRASPVTPQRILVGCPGLVSADGQLVKSLYLPFAAGPLRDELTQMLGTRVLVHNDTYVQASGAADPGERLVYIAIGTGVGGVVVAKCPDDRGRHGFAGELGHIPSDHRLLPCRCGRFGCLDTAAGGRYLEQRLGVAWWKDRSQGAVVENLIAAGAALGAAAAIAASIVDPDRLVIAGRLTAYQEVTTKLFEVFRLMSWLAYDIDLVEDGSIYALRGALALAP